MNYSEFETIQKIKKSAAAIRKEEKDLTKREKALVENQLLVQKPWTQKGRASLNGSGLSKEAVNSMRAKIAEMKAKHNKFVQENSLRLELFPD